MSKRSQMRENPCRTRAGGTHKSQKLTRSPVRHPLERVNLQCGHEEGVAAPDTRLVLRGQYGRVGAWGKREFEFPWLVSALFENN